MLMRKLASNNYPLETKAIEVISTLTTKPTIKIGILQKFNILLFDLTFL
jgi:hypothetical protein